MGVELWCPESKLGSVAQCSYSEIRGTDSSGCGVGRLAERTQQCINKRLSQTKWKSRVSTEDCPPPLPPHVHHGMCMPIYTRTQTHRHQVNKAPFESLKKKEPCTIIIFPKHYTSQPFIFLPSLNQNTQSNRFDWRNLFTFPPRYIDDIIIDSFDTQENPSVHLPFCFFKWIITIIFFLQF